MPCLTFGPLTENSQKDIAGRIQCIRLCPLKSKILRHRFRARLGRRFGATGLPHSPPPLPSRPRLFRPLDRRQKRLARCLDSLRLQLATCRARIGTHHATIGPVSTSSPSAVCSKSSTRSFATPIFTVPVNRRLAIKIPLN